MCRPLALPSGYKGRLGKSRSQPGWVSGKEDQFQHITLISSSSFWKNTGHHIINHNTARTDNARFFFLPGNIKARTDGTGGQRASSAGNANTGKMHSPTPHIHIHTHCMCVHTYHNNPEQSFTGWEGDCSWANKTFFKKNLCCQVLFFFSTTMYPVQNIYEEERKGQRYFSTCFLHKDISHSPLKHQGEVLCEYM